MKRTLTLVPPFRVEYQAHDQTWHDVFNGDGSYGLFSDAESIFEARSGMFATVRLIDSEGFVIKKRCKQ